MTDDEKGRLRNFRHSEFVIRHFLSIPPHHIRQSRRLRFERVRVAGEFQRLEKLQREPENGFGIHSASHFFRCARTA